MSKNSLVLKNHTLALTYNLALAFQVKKLKFIWEGFTVIQTLQAINFQIHFSL